MFGYVKDLIVEIMLEKGLDVVDVTESESNEDNLEIFVRNGTVTDVYRNLNLKLNKEELSKHLETYSGTSFLLANSESKFINHNYVGEDINNAKALMYITPSPLVLKANDKRVIYSAEIIDSEETLERLFKGDAMISNGGGVVCEYQHSPFKVRCVMLNGKVVFGYKTSMHDSSWKHVDEEGYTRFLQEEEFEALTEIADELKTSIGLNCGVVDLLINDSNEFFILNISEELMIPTEILMWFSSKSMIREAFNEMVSMIVKSRNATVRLDNKYVTPETLEGEIGGALANDVSIDSPQTLEEPKKNIEVS